MAEDVIKVRVEADGQQAKAELAGVSKSIEEVGGSAGRAQQAAGDLAGKLGDLVRTTSQLREFIGKAIGAIGLATATFRVFYEGTRDVIEGLEKIGIEIDGPLTSAFSRLTDAMVGADEQLGEIKTAFNSLSKEQLQAQSILDKYVNTLQKKRDELAATAVAIDRQVASEKASGEVQKTTLEWIQKTLDAYVALGDAIPPALQKTADALGVMASEQEAAAEAAEKAAAREIEAAEKAAAKEEERAVREAEAHAKRVAAALDAAIAKEEAAAREVAAAEAGVRAIEDELRQFADADTPEGLAELNAELADLRSQDILTPQQLKRLQDLEDITGSIWAKTKDWRVESEKLAKQDEILTRLEKARAKALELEEKRLAAMLETLAIQNQEFREAANTTNDFGGAAGDAAMSFEELERANADALDTAGRFGGEADDLAGTLGDLGEAAGDFSKELGDLAKETDKADSGFGKMGEQADELIPKLEEIKRLVSEIKEEAGSISLGL